MPKDITLFRNPSIEQTLDLLTECQLPVSDITCEHLQYFWGCGTSDQLYAVAGIEMFDDTALLRSLAVTENARGAGYAKALVTRVEEYAKKHGVNNIYLLTTTAEHFFLSLGYIKTERKTAPASIKCSKEFSSLCPDSAAFLIKPLFN